MWPGRRYWIVNFVIWLVFTVGIVLAYSSDGGVSLANSSLAAAEMTVMWAIVSYALWRLLRAGEDGTRAGTASEWLWFSAWVLLGLAAAAGAVALSPFILLSAAAVGGFVVYCRGIGRSAYGVVGGLGSLLALSMAWENARTPHECQAVPHEANTFSCPNHAGFVLPFALGVLLLACGVVAQLRRRAAY